MKLRRQMERASTTYSGEERKHHLEDPGVDGRIILKLISEKWDESVDWIDLAQDRDRQRAVVNAVMNLRVP
jgi:hypothetical protein